ncbi:hypothetical protein V5T82_12380 [Magnetovibrio sp. PR-2]|uniref:hypothetical protein n=1 Tax=Magnetovibrio sp. PR-2 TaxID=3120356 RepID=UPI002FCDFBFE
MAANTDSEIEMVDPGTLITSVSASIELAKGLLKVKEIAESAEAKMAIAELTSKLAESQVQVAELKTDHIRKDELIHELEKRLETRETLVRHNEMYFRADENGNPTGDPFCPRCYEADDKLIHLVHFSRSKLMCRECTNRYPKVPGETTSSPRRAQTFHPVLR